MLLFTRTTCDVNIPAVILFSSWSGPLRARCGEAFCCILFSFLLRLPSDNYRIVHNTLLRSMRESADDAENAHIPRFLQNPPTNT